MWMRFSFLIFMSLLLSACSPIQLTIEKLMSAPKLTGEFYEIDQALKSEVGNNIILKYPKSGKYKSPFIMHDIDGDGQKEAIVFYSDIDSDEIKFNILDKINNKWLSIFSAIGPGVDIEKVLISNIMGVANDQIIINWIKDNNIDRSLQIYNYEDDMFKCIYNKDYLTDVFLFDIDNDSVDEIITIDRTLKITPNAEIIKKTTKSDGVSELEVVSYVRLREGQICYKNITMGKLSNNINALFLDAQSDEPEVNDLSLYTEVIAVSKNNELVNLFYSKNNNSQLNQYLLSQTMRDQGIFCRDIDMDGIIEIPKTLSYHYDFKIENKSELKPLTMWQKYVYGNLSFCMLSVEILNDGYSFTLPNNWFSVDSDDKLESKLRYNVRPRVIAFYNEKNNELTFKNNDKSQMEIMSIRVTHISDMPLLNYLEIARRNNFVYYVKINDENKEFLLNLNKVKKCFSIIY